MTTHKQVSQAIFEAKGVVAASPGKDSVPLGEVTSVHARLPQGRVLAGKVRTELQVTKVGQVGGSDGRRVIVEAEAVVIGEKSTPEGSDVVFKSRKGIPVVREGVIQKGRAPKRGYFTNVPGEPGPEDLIDREIVAAAQALRRRSGERI
jgi:hypothetical protein